MIFAEEPSPKRGQEYRDRVRAEALEKQFQAKDKDSRVLTLDDKHREHEEGRHVGKHCTANFTDHRRMITAVRAKVGFYDLSLLFLICSPVCFSTLAVHIPTLT